METKNLIAVDTRSYNKRQFVQSLIEACGDATSATVDQVIDYLDSAHAIVDFDDQVVIASHWRDEIEEEMFGIKFAAVERVCKTDTDGETTLADWMREGDWQGMSVQSIATEWDELDQ